MEEYRKSILTKIRLAGCYFSLVAFVNILLDRYFGGTVITGFIMGFLIGGEFVVIFLIWRYGKALRDEEYLKKLYIEKNDERNRYIRSRMTETGTVVNLVLLGTAVITSGFFSLTVFFTLLAVFVVSMLVLIVLKFYYRRKI